MKKLKWFLLFFILSLAFLLGGRMILSGDFYYLFDQARDLLLTRSIVNDHTLMLIGNQSGLGGFFHGPLWIYLLVPFFVLFKGNPFSLVYFYVGLQLFTVFAAYLVGSKLYGFKGGLLVSLLITLSPAIWSPVANTVGADMEPLVYLGLFYFIVKFLRGNLKSFIFVSFFTGLALQFETASSLVLIPSVMLLLILNKSVVKNMKVMFLSLIAFLLSISTFILFDLRHKFLMLHAIIGAFSGGSKGKGYLELGNRLMDHLNSLSGVYKDLLFKENFLLILLLAAILIFGLLLFLKSKKSKYKKEFFVLLFFPVLPFIFFMLYPYAVWPEYVFGLLVSVAFAFYLAITVVWKNVFGKVLIVLFFALTFLNIFVFLQSQYLSKYQVVDSSGSYKNQKAVIEWIYKDAGNGKFGYFVYTPEIFTHGMDYLFYWYGKNHQVTIFENQKDKITYLILYPHLANDEGAYVFWKKNTLKTQGQVILSKVFYGGITVQKLLIDKTESPVDPNYYQGLIFR